MVLFVGSIFSSFIIFSTSDLTSSLLGSYFILFINTIINSKTLLFLFFFRISNSHIFIGPPGLLLFAKLPALISFPFNALQGLLLLFFLKPELQLQI